MDENNNNNLENEASSSSPKGPSVYGDPKDTPKDTSTSAFQDKADDKPKSAPQEMPATVALNETEDDIPTYSYQMPDSNSHQGSGSVFSQSNQTGYPTSEQQPSTSHQEVFGSPQDYPTDNNYYTNSNPIPEQEEVSNGFAIASLVMGILSIVFCCCSGINLIFAILGIIFSCVQKKDAAGNKPNMATVGLILSIIGGALSLISIIYGIFTLVTGSSSYSDILNSL